jgi:hypothetical protein
MTFEFIFWKDDATHNWVYSRTKEQTAAGIESAARFEWIRKMALSSDYHCGDPLQEQLLLQPQSSLVVPVQPRRMATTNREKNLGSSSSDATQSGGVQLLAQQQQQLDELARGIDDIKMALNRLALQKPRR